ncbi:hypothetical protein D3C87_1807850 [compost metagenome]
MGANSALSNRFQTRPSWRRLVARMATSNSSVPKSTRCGEASTRTAISGLASWNNPILAASQWLANVGTLEMLSMPSTSPRESAKVSRRVSKALVTSGARRAPVSLSAICRGLRKKSGAPTRSSRILI